MKQPKDKSVKDCKHKKAYFFHDNAPAYCPDCKKYLDGGEVLSNIKIVK